MIVKVTLKEVTIEHENVSELQKDDVKVFGDNKGNNIITISFTYFKTLEKVFTLVRKGLENFKDDFEFKM